MSLGLQAAKNVLGGVMLHAPTDVTSPASNLARENPWAVTFGQPRADVEFRARPYSNVNKSTWVMPEAYKGRSEFIENTMFLLARANNSFVTSVLLPMVTRDGALMSNWNKWIFPTQMPDVIAPRGTPRLVRSRQIEGFDVMTQYGLGMTLEHGFMKSDLGMQHYRMHMRQINQSVSEGLQFQGIYKILTCEDWAKKYLLVNGAPGRVGQMERVMKRELNRWAILQTNRNAWSLLNDMIDAENDIINPNVRLTTYVIDNSIKSLIKHSYDQTNVAIRGPKAAQNIDDTLEGFRVTDNGDTVFVTRGYLTGDQGAVIAPTRRHTSVGECHQTKPYQKLRGEYSSRAMSATLYDQTNDDWATITLEDMLLNCKRFNPSNGRLYSFGDPEAMKYPRDNFSVEEQALDFLHYRNAQGNLVAVEYFGHINAHHMSADDYMKAGEIAAKALAKRLGTDLSDFIQKTQDFLGVVNIVRNYQYTAAYQAFLDATLANKDNTTAEIITYDEGVGQVRVLNGTNAFGSLPIITLDGAQGRPARGAFVVPPTHVFSYGGLKTIEQASTQGVADTYNKAMMDKVADFVGMVDRVVPVLQRFYPDSIFLNPEYALPHHTNPTAHDVFVESLVHSGTPFTQLYFNPTEGTNAGAADQVRLFGAQLESDILEGVDRALAAENGLATNAATGGATNIGGLLGGADDMGAKTQLERFLFTLTVPRDDVKAVMEKKGDVESVVRGLVARKVVLTLLSVTEKDELTKVMNHMNSILNSADLKQAENEVGKVIDIRSLLGDEARIARFAGDVLSFFDQNAGVRRKAIRSNRAVKKRIDAAIASIPAYVQRTNELVAAFGGDVLALVADGGALVADGGLQRYLRIAAESRNRLILTPLCVPHTFIDSYVNSLGTRVAGGKGVDGKDIAQGAITVLPASPSDPREVMDLRDFQAKVKVFSQVATTSKAVNTIGSAFAQAGVDSIHASPRHANTIREGIEHNSAFRSVVNRQRISSADYESHQRSVGSRLVTGDASLRADDLAVTGGAAIGAGMHSNPADFQNPYFRRHQESMTGKRNRDAAIGTDRALGGGWSENRSALADTSLWGGSSLLEEEERMMQAARLAADSSPASASNSMMDKFLNRRLTANFAGLYAAIARASDLDVHRWLSLIFLGTPVTMAAMQATIKFDLLHPFRYLLARPHARYETCTVVKMLPGLETGRTNFGHVMAEVGDDPIQRCHTVNLTYWSSALITEPKNININHNCAVVGYHGGLGAGFFDRAAYNPQQNKYGRSRHDSIFAIALPLQEQIEANPLNITGRFDWISEDGRQMGDSKSDLTYSTAAFYNGYWGWQQYRWNSDLTQAGPGPLQTHFSVPNAYCYPSMTKYDDGTSTSNLGHWKNHTVGPGCAGPRIGQGSFLNAPTVGEVYRNSQVGSVF